MNDFSLFKKLRNKKYFIKDYLKNIIMKPKKFKPSKESKNIEIKDINENRKKQINNKQNIITKRNAGIDLLRIVTMLGIVYTHIVFLGKAINRYNKYKSNLIQSITYVFWHNNAFSLISGVVSNKSTKYSNLLYLWLCAVFYSVGIRFYYLKYKNIGVRGELYQDYYPVIYGRYWYLSVYFSMFIYLPAVNKGIQYLSNPEFKLLVMSILGIFIFWSSYINNKLDNFYMHRGDSPMCLLYLYIIGAYIKKFNIEFTGIKRCIASLLYFSIFILLCFIYNQYFDRDYDFRGKYRTKLGNFIIKLLSLNLNGVIRTFQAILITLFFLQLNVMNKYLSKSITFFGQLTFGVYLIHMNVNVRNNYISKLLNGETNNLTASEVIQMLIFKSIKLFLECIIIEYLRHLLFNILKIRKICIFIEKIIFKFC